MDAELLQKAHAAITRLYYNEPLPSYDKIAETILRVAVEACAEIATRDSVLDWAGGSTGNAVGTREKIKQQIRALLD